MRPSALLAPLVGIAVQTFAPHALAIDAKVCTEAAEAGQRARAAGKLRAAQQKFAVCQTPGCPTMVQQDCSNWAGELAATMPSIVVDARDASGHDLANVTVLVDGEVLMTKIDGKAVTVEPGPHVIVYEHVGHKSISENVIIKEGVKGRVLTVKFDGDDDARTASPGAAGASRASETTDTNVRGHTAWPWILVATGGIVVAAGIVYIASAPALPSSCSKQTEICERIDGETAQDYKDRQSRAGVAVTAPRNGAIIIGVGGAFVVAGLLWHFLEPTGPKSGGLRVAPWSTASAGGLSAFGSF